MKNKCVKPLSIITVIITVFAVSICFYGCKSNDNTNTTEITDYKPNTSNATTQSNETVKTTTEIVTENGKTVDAKKAQEVKKAVTKAVGVQENDEIQIDDNGKFVYRNVRDATQVYAEERSDKREKAARQKAKDIVISLEQYYGKLTKGEENIVQIGSGDNGIDSVQYNFYYKSESGSEIRIQIDSDGIVSYIECGICF